MKITFLSDPVVSNWDSSGWYKTYLKSVFSNKQFILVKDLRSQIMQDPSALALTAYSLFFLTWKLNLIIDQFFMIYLFIKLIENEVTYILHTRPLCSFNEASIT